LEKPRAIRTWGRNLPGFINRSITVAQWKVSGQQADVRRGFWDSLALSCLLGSIQRSLSRANGGGGITQSDRDKTNTHNNDRIHNNKTTTIIMIMIMLMIMIMIII